MGRISTLSSRNSKGLCALHLVEEYTERPLGITVRSVKKFITLAMLFGRVAGLFANGFRLPDKDAFATARGEEFAATAHNASAIYYTPARISQLEGFDFRARVYGSHIGAF